MWLAPLTSDGTGGRVAKINLDPAIVAGGRERGSFGFLTYGT